MLEAKRLREEQETMVVQMRAVQDEVTARGDDAVMTGEEQAKFDKIEGEYRSHADKIATAERLERIPAVDARTEPQDVRVSERAATSGVVTERDLDRALAGWLTRGSGHQTPQHRDAMRRAGLDADAEGLTFRLLDRQPDERALSTTTPAAGGNTISSAPIQYLEKALLDYDGLRRIATVKRVSTGVDYPVATMDDTGNTGADYTENDLVPEQDLTFGQVVIKTDDITSGLVRVPLKLLRDTDLPLVAEIGQALGERLGKRFAQKHVLGTDPAWNGLLAGAADSGVTFAEKTPTYEELLRLFYAVPAPYRRSPKCGWACSDKGVMHLRLIRDDAGNPVWQSGLVGGEPDRFLGKPVTVVPEIPDPAAGERSMVFGDFGKFVMVDVQDVQTHTLTERYMDRLQHGYLAHASGGCRVVDAGAGALVTAGVIAGGGGGGGAPSGG